MKWPSIIFRFLAHSLKLLTNTHEFCGKPTLKFVFQLIKNESFHEIAMNNLSKTMNIYTNKDIS